MDTEHNGGVEVHFGVGLTRTWLCEAVPKVMAGTSLTTTVSETYATMLRQLSGGVTPELHYIRTGRLSCDDFHVIQDEHVGFCHTSWNFNFSCISVELQLNVQLADRPEHFISPFTIRRELKRLLVRALLGHLILRLGRFYGKTNCPNCSFASSIKVADGAVHQQTRLRQVVARGVKEISQWNVEVPDAVEEVLRRTSLSDSQVLWRNNVTEALRSCAVPPKTSSGHPAFGEPKEGGVFAFEYSALPFMLEELQRSTFSSRRCPVGSISIIPPVLAGPQQCHQLS